MKLKAEDHQQKAAVTVFQPHKPLLCPVSTGVEALPVLQEEGRCRSEVVEAPPGSQQKRGVVL